MKLARWLLPLLSLLCVLAFTWWDLSRAGAGPGPIHPAHAAVAELDGGANCTGCHRDGAVAAEQCLGCHAPIARQRELEDGLHGRLPPQELAQCQRCHSDHHGDGVPLIAPHAFPRAGVEHVASYDHGHVAFGLAGVHATLACDRCHAGADAVEPPAGGRFLGLSQVCTGCHEDAHAGAFGASCQECHGQQTPWSEVPDFRHQRFVLVGAHQRVACASCHAKDTDRAVEHERQAELPVRSCGACHQNPHGGESAPRALAIRDAEDCAGCHDSAAWQPRFDVAARHEQGGFPLRGPHAAATCVSCHGDGQQAGRWSGVAVELAACAACHDARHTPELLAAASAAGPVGGCAGCHQDGDDSFAAGRVSPEQHRAIGFDLAPPHADVACAECHRGTAVAERYPGRLAEDCRGCHVDLHGGQFPDAGRPERPRQCTECHAEDRFAPHRFGPAAHVASGFPLRGAHDAVACSSCHDRVVDGVRRFRGTTQRCDECHADRHRGRFDRAGLPVRVAGREGCARCHDSAAFAPVAVAFDHVTWTGHELVGAHARASCESCHPRSPDGALGTAPGRTCASCHVDPHLGQFDGAAAGATDCSRCHDASDWARSRFDHARDSRFRLDAVHAELACASCHLAHAFEGRQVVRYRPLGVLCGDCHQLGRNGGKQADGR